jgi:crotonobetainyl-CoA:carnitine CoA-transferase CaiB-like acyl-CoA transferase
MGKMPLEGIRVLDWTIWQQGPVATSMLGDLGAEVIKIEERIGGDPSRGMKRVAGLTECELPHGRNFYFEVNNRNKKGIKVDLKKEKGKKIICDLVENSDVFVQNFRANVRFKLGLDYETLSKYNPKLIYANASGYGTKGPDWNKPAFDYAAQARTGMMYLFSQPGFPPLWGTAGVADQIGAIMLSYGILAALLHRERSGEGQEIDVSLMASAMWVQDLDLAGALMRGEKIRAPFRSEASNPLWNHYQCGDGRWIVLAMTQSDRHWPALCKAMGLEELIKDPRFIDDDTRHDNCGDLISILDKRFAAKPAEEWAEIFTKQDIINQVVQHLEDLPNDPQVIANEYIGDFDHPVLGKVKMVNAPYKLSKSPAKLRLPAPEFGEHTEQILLDICGYDWEQITELRNEEVI